MAEAARVAAASLGEADEESFSEIDHQFFVAIENDGYDRAADEYALRTTAA